MVEKTADSQTPTLTPPPFELRLAEVNAAAQRIAGSVRRTPMLKLTCMKDPPAGLAELWLKLELLQVTGSFKARGAINKLRSLTAAEVGRGIVTASSGNHGLAVAYAGYIAKVPTMIFLPEPVPAAKVDKLYRWGARIERVGQVWDDSNDAALAHAEKSGMTYIHPFADPMVMAGQGTLGLELLEDVPLLDTVIISIGGGGLIGGVAATIKALAPKIRIIGVEPTGAPTLYESVRAGKVVRLDSINTLAGTLAPRQSDAMNLSLVQRHVDDIVLVTDDEMRAAARWLWFESSIAAELSGAAAMAALHCGRYRPNADERVGVVVCGAGNDGIP
jgi:threonine dehydratase